MRRFLSIPPATHQQGWWPTPRWALRRLAMYGIAALSGGLLFAIYTLVFVSPRETPTSPTLPTETRPPAAAPRRIIQQPLTIAQEPPASVKLIAFEQLLENKDKDPEAIRAFIDRVGLQQEYPLGFALFYSNGQKTLYYIPPSSGNISFDPSLLKIFRVTDNSYCIGMLPVRVQGKTLPVFNVCFKGVVHIARVENVLIEGKLLAASGEGTALVIGMKPAQ